MLEPRGLCWLFLGCAAGNQPGCRGVACSAGPAPGRISRALPARVRSRVSTRSEARAWGAAGRGRHGAGQRGGSPAQRGHGGGAAPCPCGKTVSPQVQTPARASPCQLCPQDQGSPLKLFSVGDRGIAALSLLLFQLRLFCWGPALELPTPRFLVLLAAMLRFTQHQSHRGRGLHTGDRGSLLLRVPPTAAAGVSLQQEAEGGARDGKLAASSEGSGKNELKPRKMRPRRRVGGEAKGGHGEALGNEGRKEGGGAGGGPGAACGPQLGPQLGQVVRGLGGPSSKCSRGYPSAIRPITIHPWLSTGPSATSTGPTCSRCYLPPRCSCQCHQHQCYRSRCAPLSSPPPWDKGPRWLLARTWLCWDASPAGCPGPPRAWAPLEWAAETRLFFARFPQSMAQGHPSCRRQNPLPPGRQRCTEPVRVGHRQDEPSVPAGS